MSKNSSSQSTNLALYNVRLELYQQVAEMSDPDKSLYQDQVISFKSHLTFQVNGGGYRSRTDDLPDEVGTL
ncbi:hypothetical protein [Mangrovivirga cuniculi]|uniref:hypothetical protein n=1 Tax=Mangrovivirga cuniculi TaxID=2715131 RepID=UPI00158621E1|nr:hypothetical protein [Mangrovivirga cuniculi]